MAIVVRRPLDCAFPAVARHRGRVWLRLSVAAAPTFSAIFYSGAVAAAAPVAVDDQRVMPPNTSLTLNVLTNDFDPDGDALGLIEFSQPENGTVSFANEGGALVYQPAPGFTGVDSFTYQIQESAEEGLTATAVVIISVRAGDYADFATTGNSVSLAEALSAACGAARSRTEAELGDSGRALLQRCRELDLISAANPDGFETVLRQIAPDETLTQAQVTAEASVAQTRAVSQRISQRRMSTAAPVTLNGGALFAARPARGGGASADADSALQSRLGAFASVQVEGADKDRTAFENGYDSDGFTLTAGADYFLTQALIVGAAYSYSESDLKYSDGDGELASELSSALLFGSYLYADFSFDLQAGYSATQYDSQRFLHYAGLAEMDSRITGATEGSQWLLHGQVQWQWSNGPLSLLPFARFEWQRLDIDGYGEQGGTGLEMQLADQEIEQSAVATGLQANYVVNFNWGVLIPNAGVEFWSETHSRHDDMGASIAFDPGQNSSYNLSAEDTESFYSELSFGASAVLPRGLSAFALYRQTLGYSHLDAFSVQLGVRYEFGG